MNLKEEGKGLKGRSETSGNTTVEVQKTTERSSGEQCPDCGGKVYRAGNCPFCPSCGWSRCP